MLSRSYRFCRIGTWLAELIGASLAGPEGDRSLTFGVVLQDSVERAMLAEPPWAA
jgi:hypothetical protein